MEIKDILSNISETMSDGYKFLRVLELCKEMEDQAKAGDPNAAQILKIVNRFNNLVNIANRN